MSNISIKLNVSQLSHVRRKIKGKDGNLIDCLIIPIQENKLYVGEKGVYLDMTAIEIKDRSKFSADQKDTHLLKQDVPKEVYEAMSDEQKKAMPILGKAIQWGAREANPNTSTAFEPSSNYTQETDEDDLPF